MDRLDITDLYSEDSQDMNVYSFHKIKNDI